jgi:hypothetical protein
MPVRPYLSRPLASRTPIPKVHSWMTRHSAASRLHSGSTPPELQNIYIRRLFQATSSSEVLPTMLVSDESHATPPKPDRDCAATGPANEKRSRPYGSNYLVHANSTSGSEEASDMRRTDSRLRSRVPQVVNGISRAGIAMSSKSVLGRPLTHAPRARDSRRAAGNAARRA